MSDTPVELKYGYRLSAIRLQNFMAFEDTGWIELRPITLLFGRNSSGKSAIIRALLLLKQSLESRDPNAPLIFSGSWVDLGSYYNAVHRHKLERDISFGFRLSRSSFEEPPPADSASEGEKRAYEERLQKYHDGTARWIRASSGLPSVDVDDSPLELHLTFGLVNENSPPILKSLAIYGYRTPDDGQPKAVLVFQMVRRDDGSWRPQSDVPLDYEAEEGSGDNRRSVKHEQFSDGLWKSLVPEMSSGCIPRRLWLPDAANFLQSDRPPDWQVINAALGFFWDHLVPLLRDAVYLPPLRDEPRRYYRADHGWVRELTKEKLKEVNQWLSSAAINAEVFVEPLADKEGVAAVYLRESDARGAGLDTNLRDVGSGVSQVLPVMVGSLQAPRGGAIIVEQPELHLHPSAQAELADYFDQLVEDRQSLCLLETHSSALLNRVRRRVAEGRRSHKQVNLIFVEQDQCRSRCRGIGLDATGEYTEDIAAFDGFFSSDANELTLMKIASAPPEDQRDIEKTRRELKSFEHLFDGERVDVMFALLGVHPASAIRMMRVWAEYVTKCIASERNVQMKADEEFNSVVQKLLSQKIFNADVETLADSVRQSANNFSHASHNGIPKPETREACHSLKSLLLFLEKLEKKGLIKRQ